MAKNLTSELVLKKIYEFHRVHESVSNPKRYFGIDTIALVLDTPVEHVFQILQDLAEKGIVELTEQKKKTGKNNVVYVSLKRA